MKSLVILFAIVAMAACTTRPVAKETVRIDQRSSCYVRQQEVPCTDIGDYVVGLHPGKRVEVSIQANRKATYKVVFRVKSSLSSAGIATIGLITPDEH